MNLTNKKAFTLAEMMVVMLILSLIIAASLPIITKKTKTSGATWRYAANNSDIYYGIGNTQGVAIGIAGFDTATSDSARLLLNTSSATQNQILFKQASTIYARLVVDSLHNIGLSNVAPTGWYSTALGNGATASNAGSASAYGSTAIGYDAQATIIFPPLSVFHQEPPPHNLLHLELML